jgi:UPF0755 protein
MARTARTGRRARTGTRKPRTAKGPSSTRPSKPARPPHLSRSRYAARRRGAGGRWARTMAGLVAVAAVGLVGLWTTRSQWWPRYKRWTGQYVTVTIPEGFHRYAIAERLANSGVCDRESFLRVTEDPAMRRALQVDGPTLEGYLFPDTYEFSRPTPCSSVARTMVENWRKRTVPLLTHHSKGVTSVRETLGWGIHEIVTLASIVEKEARIAEERPMIAEVFLNRMRSPSFTPKRLQTDPSVAYGCLQTPAPASCRDGLEKAITKEMLLDATNRYNTYRFEGLPPGPIANPGAASMRAVLAPSHHQYFYFVAKGDGSHAFSKTLQAHNEAVRRHKRVAQ